MHRALYFLKGELNIWTTAFLASPPHECGFVRQFIRIGAGLCGEYLICAFRSDTQDASLEDVGPVTLREVAERRPIDQAADHFRGGGSKKQTGIIVSHWNRSNLGVDVKQDVAVEVGNVVAIALLVVRHHIQVFRVKHLSESLNCLDALRAGNCS